MSDPYAIDASDAVTFHSDAATSLLGTCLVTPEQLASAREQDLSETILALIDEQRRRAIEAADPAAIAELAFEEAFDYSGKPLAPYISHGLLVCPGGKATKSKTSHDCCFVSLGDTWVWEYEDVLYDEMKQTPGARWMQSITLIAPYEGLEVDQVAAQARGGGRCQMQSANSYTIQSGRLVPTKQRKKAAGGHR